MGSVKGRPSSMRSTRRLAIGQFPYALTSTSATCLHRQKYVHRFICSGVACGHVRDQRGALLPLALRECLFDVLHNMGNLRSMRSNGKIGDNSLFVWVMCGFTQAPEFSARLALSFFYKSNWRCVLSRPRYHIAAVLVAMFRALAWSAPLMQ